MFWWYGVVGVLNSRKSMLGWGVVKTDEKNKLSKERGE